MDAPLVLACAWGGRCDTLLATPGPYTAARATTGLFCDCSPATRGGVQVRRPRVLVMFHPLRAFVSARLGEHAAERFERAAPAAVDRVVYKTTVNEWRTAEEAAARAALPVDHADAYISAMKVVANAKFVSLALGGICAHGRELELLEFPVKYPERYFVFKDDGSGGASAAGRDLVGGGDDSDAAAAAVPVMAEPDASGKRKRGATWTQGAAELLIKRADAEEALKRAGDPNFSAIGGVPRTAFVETLKAANPSMFLDFSAVQMIDFIRNYNKTAKRAQREKTGGKGTWGRGGAKAGGGGSARRSGDTSTASSAAQPDDARGGGDVVGAAALPPPKRARLDAAAPPPPQLAAAERDPVNPGGAAASLLSLGTAAAAGVAPPVPLLQVATRSAAVIAAATTAAADSAELLSHPPVTPFLIPMLPMLPRLPPLLPLPRLPW